MLFVVIRILRSLLVKKCHHCISELNDIKKEIYSLNVWFLLIHLFLFFKLNIETVNISEKEDLIDPNGSL